MRIKEHSYTALLLAAVSLPLLLRLLALLLPEGRLWGVDALKYLDTWMVLLFTLLPPAAALLVLKLKGTAGGGTTVKGTAGSAGTPVMAVLLILAGAIAIILFPMQTFFFGDGGLLIPQIHRFSLGESMDTEMLLNAKSSPLSGALLLFLIKAIPEVLSFLGAATPTTALYPFPVLSLIAFLGAATYILKSFSGSERVSMLLLLFGGAGGLLYFGYVEYYAPFYAATMVYWLAGKRYLRSETSVFVVLLAYTVALLSHYAALALLPSLFVMLLQPSRRQSSRQKETQPLQFLRPFVSSMRSLLGVMGGGLLLWLLIYFVSGLHASDNRIIMPLSAVTAPAGIQSYTLLSSWHLIDYLNFLLLLAPAGFFLLIIALLLPDLRRKLDTAVLRFYVAALLPFSGFLFFANASLGLARDWDLTAAAGMLFLLLGMEVLRETAPRRAATYRLAFATACVALSLPWLAVNIDADRSAERFENLIALDDSHIYADYALSGYEALRKFYFNRGDMAKEIEMARRKVEIVDYPSNYRELLGKSLALRDSDRDKAIDLQNWMLLRLSGTATELTKANKSTSYAISLAQIDSLGEAIAYAAYVHGDFPSVSASVETLLTGLRREEGFQSLRALEAYGQKRYAEAAEELQIMLNRGFHNPKAYLLLGTALALENRHSESLRMFEQGYEEFPGDAMLTFTLGKYYVLSGRNPEAAAALLGSCLQRGEPRNRLSEARQLLTRLK